MSWRLHGRPVAIALRIAPITKTTVRFATLTYNRGSLMKAYVYVSLKKSVLDPQGKTIHGALTKIGYKEFARRDGRESISKSLSTAASPGLRRKPKWSGSRAKFSPTR
jgi:hypothetical protein